MSWTNWFLDGVHNAYYKAEVKIKEVLDGNFNFILILRKHLSNETDIAKLLLINKCIQVAVIFIAAEVILLYFNYHSILGLIPKVLALGIIVIVKYILKHRRNKGNV